MLITDRDRLRESVTALADKLGFNRGSLIPILQEVKEKYRGIDSYAMQIIADVLGIHPVEVYSVATFYAFLHPETEGRYIFRLCRTLSCELRARTQIARQLQTRPGHRLRRDHAPTATSASSGPTAWACATRVPRCW